tara:strand:- start:467 stop:772 length:306 start_codon:yes stop_codon:yes gene_type:complete
MKLLPSTGEALELKHWKVLLKPGWDVHFKKFDKPTRERIMKKLDQMEKPAKPRGLRSSNYLVEEVGQYRIAYEADEQAHTKSVHFIGNHKQYEKWYGQGFI